MHISLPARFSLTQLQTFRASFLLLRISGSMFGIHSFDLNLASLPLIRFLIFFLKFSSCSFSARNFSSLSIASVFIGKSSVFTFNPAFKLTFFFTHLPNFISLSYCLFQAAYVLIFIFYLPEILIDTAS